MPATADRLQRERDLYRRCLEIGSASEPSALLVDALAALCEVVEAQSGYIELRDTTGTHEQSWAADLGVDDEERTLIRERISRGVVAEAIESGETVHSPSALLDARFEGRESVRRSEIQAVLCVPLHARDVIGAVYLQNRIDGGPFNDDDIACVETVARFVSEIGARLLELERRRELADATSAIRAKLVLDGVIGRSPVLAKLLHRLAAIATMDGNVLLTGRPGSGKSLFARVIHDNSQRADGPFVAINCASIPETLLESELFGSERGAHSGVATKGTPGKVLAAEGGTLFLDEIGELPLSAQAKLLDLLQNKTFYRLGSATPTRVDVRIITATNRDLDGAVAEHSFREDLFFRVKSLHLAVPTLAARREDIPLLAEHLCAEICQRNGLDAMPPSAAALAALQHEDWPGNIRELAVRCQEAVVNARIDGVTAIELRHFFPADDEGRPKASETLQTSRAAWERTFLRGSLQQRDWNVARTARELEVSRSHLNALIRRHELQRD